MRLRSFRSSEVRGEGFPETVLHDLPTAEEVPIRSADGRELEFESRSSSGEDKQLCSKFHANPCLQWCRSWNIFTSRQWTRLTASLAAGGTLDALNQGSS